MSEHSSKFFLHNIALKRCLLAELCKSNREFMQTEWEWVKAIYAEDILAQHDERQEDEKQHSFNF